MVSRSNQIPWSLANCPNVLYKNESMNKKIKEALSNWSTSLTSFSARIDIVKMSILPRLLYLFMSLPVKIPTHQFQEWDKHIFRFIWNGKKPRIKYSTLMINREGGGMSLPNLRDYYYSAQLRIVVGWCDGRYEAKWKEMEGECKGVPIQAIIGDFKLMSNYQDHVNSIVLYILHTWFEVMK